jgi:hypothetical protein
MTPRVGRKRKRKRSKEENKTIISCPKQRLLNLSLPPRLRTTWLPEQYSSPLFINHVVSPYWLAFRSSVHLTTVSPPTHCMRREVYKSCETAQQVIETHRASRCMTSRVVRQKNMAMSPAGRDKNYCAVEDQQQFTLTDQKSVGRVRQSHETETYGHGSRGPEPRMTVLTRASSNLPDRSTKSQESRRKIWS